MSPTSSMSESPKPVRASVDWTACQGHGGCADLLPELITLDEWGYPVIRDRPVPSEARRRARKAVSECPALALRLRE
jgi:ferredoxin